METFGKARRRGALDAANAMHCDKRIVGEPMLRPLRFEMLHEQGDLLNAYLV